VQSSSARDHVHLLIRQAGHERRLGATRRTDTAGGSNPARRGTTKGTARAQSLELFAVWNFSRVIALCVAAGATFGLRLGLNSLENSSGCADRPESVDEPNRGHQDGSWSSREPVD
jgi:hypothetical protein